MNTNNFLKKHLSIIIIVSISIIIVIFWCYKNTKNYQQNNETLSNLESKKEEIKFLDQNQKNNNLQKDKNEIKRSKFLTTQTHFDQIKNYIFSENDDKILLLNNLSKIEQESIEKIKNSWKFKLSLLKEQQNSDANINVNKDCDNFKKQIELLQPQKEILKKQLEPKELEQNILKEKIDKMKYQRAQISPSWRKVYERINNIKVENHQPLNKLENNRLTTEIEKLQDEEIELIGQITKIKTEIKKSESKQKMYNNMLSSAESLRNVFQNQDKNSELQYKNLILYELNSLYEITNRRSNQIKKRTVINFCK
ncbi:MAG: hypothetical protein ACN23H_00810 [Candidatus Phytoplasma vitis]|nr:MAG: hypothetical protein M6G77_00685 [Candidatus Phytoplasma vitis]